MSDTNAIIWALDQRDRCIACPSTPRANAVVLHLAEDGSLARAEVESWAQAGVMAAGVAWPGVDQHLDDADWLDLEDAVTGLDGLASVVAVVGGGGAAGTARTLAERVGGVLYAGQDAREHVLERLTAAAPV